jgi:Nucleotidyl transferase AbiEii toxin, Type IV TA system
MNLAVQIAGYRERGFTSEQAEVIAVMRVAAGVLFRDFPESFLLYGGAPLLLFHESVRHSADLDLLGRVDKLPTAEDLRTSLATGLAPVAEALNLAPLLVELSDGHVLVKTRGNSLLFKVDITRGGSVIESEVEQHAVEIDEESVTTVNAASRDFLLLQKAECFLLRRIMKVRDAFDIHRLRKSGVVLNEHLENHLHDTLMNHEIEAQDIFKRIDQVDEKRCVSELRSLLPPEVFEALAQEKFFPLRDALQHLYRRWLEEE